MKVKDVVLHDAREVGPFARQVKGLMETEQDDIKSSDLATEVLG